MDVFYEESAIVTSSGREQRKYNLFHVISIILIVLGILTVIIAVNIDIQLIWFWLGVAAVFALGAVACFWLKLRYNVNYDYAFVTGEIRIAKVLHNNRRKLVTVIQADDILQLGDADSPSFDGFLNDPNDSAAEGKFFLYVVANDNGKKMYVLECREELLIHILHFTKRTVLASDYVAQDKK